MVNGLRVVSLDFGYPGLTVGRNVDLDLRTGEVVCLLGPNGCGKTTLFKTMLGLLPSQGGQIFLDEGNMAGLKRKVIAARIAYVPQAHAAVFPYTVLDMVMMGRTAHRGVFASPGSQDRSRALQALDQLGIADLEGRDYTRISGGQRQLVLIARALAQDAGLIVMDEPTASLDFGNQVLVLNEIRRLAHGDIGILLSTHNPDHVFSIANRVYLLARGVMQTRGTPADVLTPALLSKVYGVPVVIETLSNGRHVCVAEEICTRPGQAL